MSEIKDFELMYLFGRRVEATRNEVVSMMFKNVKELKEIMTEFHDFFTKLAEEKGEVEDGQITHRFATLLYSTVKLYFFTNWRMAGIEWPDILTLELALTEVAMEIADSVKEDTKKEKRNDINVR